MRPGQQPQHMPRRDGSEASKAKSNKTVDVYHIYCNQFDNINKISALFNENKILPPLESSDRYLLRPCEILAKYVNRRKCEVKGRYVSKYFAELQFCRYNPDGRFLFVGAAHGSVYLYNTYDFSFHYYYYICNTDNFKNFQALTDMQFYPDNSNLTFISTEKGTIVTIPNLLHFDSQDRQINKLNVFEEQSINRLAVSSSGDELAACGQNGRLVLISTKYRFGPQIDRTVTRAGAQVIFQKGVNGASYLPANQQVLACCGDYIALVDSRAGDVAQCFPYQSYGEDIVNTVKFAPRSSLLLALGTSGLKVFDIRETRHPVFCTKAKSEVTSVCWNPRHQDGFVVGDVNGEINFYDLRFTTYYFAFEQPQPLFNFHEYSGHVAGLAEASHYAQSTAAYHYVAPNSVPYLYPVGTIGTSHHGGGGQGVRIIDLDMHPLGNSLATAGADRDVRFWTYFGAGSYYFDKFHGGSVDPTKIDLYFNQSHRDLMQYQSGESDFFQTLRDIRAKETREGEDIFSREEVYEYMRAYICTAEDRYRAAEEQAGGFVRDRELNRMVYE